MRVMMSALTKTLVNLFWRICGLLKYWTLQLDHTLATVIKMMHNKCIIASLFRVEIGRQNLILQNKPIP